MTVRPTRAASHDDVLRLTDLALSGAGVHLSVQDGELTDVHIHFEGQTLSLFDLAGEPAVTDVPTSWLADTRGRHVGATP